MKSGSGGKLTIQLTAPGATHLLLSCEHAGHLVPSKYRKRFAAHQPLLQTHRGWDPGTRQLGEQWAEALGYDLHLSTTTRLLIDLNRSEHHRRLFSEITEDLSAEEKEEVKATYYRPHRQAIVDEIKQAIAAGKKVVHLALHSFTPVLDGRTRTAEVGLLYDPRRAGEASFCRSWRAALQVPPVDWRVRMNYPYRGTADGLTTALRRQFAPEDYVGVELEFNQQLVMQGTRCWRAARERLIATCHETLAGFRTSNAVRPAIHECLPRRAANRTCDPF